MELLAFLKHKFEQKHRVSVERVVSGIGLTNVYEFLSSRFPEKVDLVTHHKVSSRSVIYA
jgi:glucokinase